jgi:hypothetical protein
VTGSRKYRYSNVSPRQHTNADSKKGKFMETKVYVFMTSVLNTSDTVKLVPHLSKIMPIKQWHFDLKNSDDKIFRVEATENISRKLITLFQKEGFECVELHAGPANEAKPAFRILDLKRFANLVRTSALMLFFGSTLFWIGAFTPPYRQWMTNDMKEYLTIIYDNSKSWYFIHTAFLLGILVTAFGFVLMSEAFANTNHGLFPRIANRIFAFGSVFITLNFAFRLTVTTQAAKQYVLQKIVHDSFQSWLPWSNLIFAIYMVMGYLSCVCLGYSFWKTTLIPKWVSGFCLYFGLSGMLMYPVGFTFFQPP